MYVYIFIYTYLCKFPTVELFARNPRLAKKDKTICLKMLLYQDLAECNKCHHSIYLLNIPGSITIQNNDNVHLFWWESSQKQCVKCWFQFWFHDNTPKIPQVFFFRFFHLRKKFDALRMGTCEKGSIKGYCMQGLCHSSDGHFAGMIWKKSLLKPRVLKLNLLHDILLL